MLAMILRQRHAVLAKVGDVVEARVEAKVFLLGDIAAARVLALAEIQRECHLLLVGDVLAVEDQHGVFVHAGLDLDRLVPGQGLAQIDARHLADEMLVKLADRNRHRVSPEVRFS